MTNELTPDGPANRMVSQGGVGERDAVDVGDVSAPTKLIRIASTVRVLLDEVETLELDEQGRSRLAAVHDAAVDQLRELVSDDLREELAGMEVSEGATPTGAELRVAQAQLGGWLQGLIHGIQASIASQQLAWQQQVLKDQLTAMREEERAADGASRYL